MFCRAIAARHFKGLDHRSLRGLLRLLFPLVLLFVPLDGLAHERWILTDAQIHEWISKPPPALWKEWTWLNATMVSGFLVFAAGWIWLGFTGARELFPDLQARLGSYGEFVAPIIRFCLAWILISSSFGLEPRYGVMPMTSPTLFAPDLELSQSFPAMPWLRWVEFILGVGFLLGTYVRVLAAVLLFLILIGTLTYQSLIYAYAGALIGVSVYLLYQGPGRFFLPLPIHPAFIDWRNRLEAFPRARAQAIMRLLTGINIFYLAVAYKLLQPNLCIGILTLHDIHLMGLPPDVATLLMTLVEVTSGILIIVGVLLRPLALFFLGAFLMFAAMLPESFMSHALFYSVMFSFLFNSAGHFAMPEAKDKKARILILGGTVGGIHAAMKVERLIGQFSEVEIVLVSEQPNILFYPLLPEVIGGSMQPGNAVNPIRRIVQHTQVILGTVLSVDSKKRKVFVQTADDRQREIPYDELILAQFMVPNLNRYPGLMAHASPINSVGDALHIRKLIMNRVEMAELEEDSDRKSRLLTFAVVGSGQRACGTAEEIAAMLTTAKSSYTVLEEHGWSVNLYEDIKVPFSDFEADIRPRVERLLNDAGVTIEKDREMTAVTEEGIVFANGDRAPASLVVNSCFTMPTLQVDGLTLSWPLETDETLKVQHLDHVWNAFPPSGMNQGRGGFRRYTTTSDWMDLGQHAGGNAWAASQGYATQKFSFKHRWVMAFNMGRHSVARLMGILVSGLPAWFFSRMTNLATMPGLERNLRILIDWTLDVPFRADIAVLAPETSRRLQTLHYETGDIVISQGDDADTAYVVRSGTLEVIRDRKKIGTLKEGDIFGEVALVQGGRRTATVKCLSPCELTVFAREDFDALSFGSSNLAHAIRQQAADRTKGQI